MKRPLKQDVLFIEDELLEIARYLDELYFSQEASRIRGLAARVLALAEPGKTPQENFYDLVYQTWKTGDKT
jgi:hypothetical protein